MSLNVVIDFIILLSEFIVMGEYVDLNVCELDIFEVVVVCFVFVDVKENEVLLSEFLKVFSSFDNFLV